MARTWAPLWSSIVNSSVWSEDYAVRVLFTSMLALKDHEHIVHGTAYELAHQAKMTEAEVLACLKVLSSPDTKRLEPQPFEGRRIEKVEGGWRIINGEKYNTLMRQAFLEHRRAYKALKEREYRKRRKEQSQMRREAKIEGAQEAIRDGFKDVSEQTESTDPDFPA